MNLPEWMTPEIFWQLVKIGVYVFGWIIYRWSMEQEVR
jgi:hypothetical protein